MSTDIEARVGGISGRYKKIGKAPLVLKSCDHAAFIFERFMRKPRMVLFHGNEDGDNTIKEHQVGDKIK